jgi:hypothetical protein
MVNTIKKFCGDECFICMHELSHFKYIFFIFHHCNVRTYWGLKLAH